MPAPAETFKIFISHSTIPDGELANWIADSLDIIHIRAFVYQRYQMGGQNRFDIIKSMIKQCRHFLAILTKDGIASQWVNQEIGYSIAIGRNPIPIFEVDPFTKTVIQSKGFVELNDPIPYNKGDKIRLMAQIIYTLWNLSLRKKSWRDLIHLSCKCGNEFEGKLQIGRWWKQYVKNPKPFSIAWPCDKCKNKIEVSFPDCHLITTI